MFPTVEIVIASPAQPQTTLRVAPFPQCSLAGRGGGLNASPLFELLEWRFRSIYTAHLRTPDTAPKHALT